jgi:hypothetical protein
MRIVSPGELDLDSADSTPDQDFDVIKFFVWRDLTAKIAGDDMLPKKGLKGYIEVEILAKNVHCVGFQWCKEVAG